MIIWNDIAKSEFPKDKENVMWYPSLEFGYMDIDSGIVRMDSNEGHWVDLAHGFEQPLRDGDWYFKHKKIPLDVVRFWTEVNDPGV